MGSALPERGKRYGKEEVCARIFHTGQEHYRSGAYYAKHKATIDGICEWADKVGMYVAFGTSDDDTYLCQYETVQFTKAMCSGLSNELKARLKAEWKSSVQLGYQAFGDCW